MSTRTLPKPPLKDPLAPTEEQSHILSLHKESKGNLLITALAGSGKTTMLELIMEQEREPTLYLVFNTRNKTEAEERVAEKLEHGWPLAPVKIKTLNSLGHGIWSNACSGRLSLEKDSQGRVVKTQNLLRVAVEELPKRQQAEAWEEFSLITDSIARAKALGYIPEGKFTSAKRLIRCEDFYSRLEEEPSDLAVDLTEKVLTASILAAYRGSIDFNDQVYMPALFGGTYPKFPLVLVDELQDLSPVNHEMLSHLKSSRLVGVGDDAQSIYQFRGAKQGGMADFKQRNEATEATLSVSFRCPEAIVRNVHWRVPEMKWIKPGGRVERINNCTPNSFVDGAAILCRNNAPLFALAFRLLGSGRSVSVAGNDIGARVLGQLKKIGNDSMNQAQLLSAIEDWRNEKLAKASTTANDTADCMRVFASHGDSLSQAIAYAEHLFAQRGTLQLLTGHKAKGLEWPVVYHLDPPLIGEHEQDRNLRYVIQTRSLDSYFEVDSREIRW